MEIGIDISTFEDLGVTLGDSITSVSSGPVLPESALSEYTDGLTLSQPACSPKANCSPTASCSPTADRSPTADPAAPHAGPVLANVADPVKQADATDPVVTNAELIVTTPSDPLDPPSDPVLETIPESAFDAAVDAWGAAGLTQLNDSAKSTMSAPARMPDFGGDPWASSPGHGHTLNDSVSSSPRGLNLGDAGLNSTWSALSAWAPASLQFCDLNASSASAPATSDDRRDLTYAN